MGVPKTTAQSLSRRERQIMDIIYRRRQATAAEVLEGMPDPPSYSAVRAMLRVLEEKGHLRHGQKGPRYVFLPTVPHEQARRSALLQLVHTFFDGSTEQAVAALLDRSDSKLSDAELARLIDRARKRGTLTMKTQLIDFLTQSLREMLALKIVAKATLVLTAAALVATALRRWFAAGRHLAWCLDIVLLAGARASEYSTHLLESVRQLRDRPATVLAATAMVLPSQLGAG